MKMKICCVHNATHPVLLVMVAHLLIAAIILAQLVLINLKIHVKAVIHRMVEFLMRLISAVNVLRYMIVDLLIVKSVNLLVEHV